jgi:alkylation response protein AidB-like acyl-CoA dehydrogenase
VTATTKPDVDLGPVAGVPGAPPEDEWITVARDVAAQLAPGTAEREAAGRPPIPEAAVFRKTGLLGLLGPPAAGGQGRPYAVALSVVRQLAEVDSGLARLLAYHYAWSHRLGPDLIDYEAAPGDVIGALGPDDATRPPHRTLSILSFQLIFVHLLLGTAEGALLAARDYTRTRTRPWIHASVDSALEDPHIIATHRELVSRVQALASLAERAERAAAWALDRGTELTAQERAEAATLGAAAKVVATQVALDTTSRVFETTGARSAKRSVGLDRFWRNARTETLHSPVASKLEEVGRFFLNDTIATPSDYR